MPTKAQKIEIDKFDGKSAEISIPIEIGSKIIGQQGLTSDGVLVATSNYSSFPSTGISNQVLGEMQKMLDILNKAGGEASKEVMVKDLQELSEKSLYL